MELDTVIINGAAKLASLGWGGAIIGLGLLVLVLWVRAKLAQWEREKNNAESERERQREQAATPAENQSIQDRWDAASRILDQKRAEAGGTSPGADGKQPSPSSTNKPRRPGT